MPRDARTVTKYVVAGLALAAMLALAPFFLASGLMAPGWAVGIFIAVWLLLFGLGCLDQTPAAAGDTTAIDSGRVLGTAA